MHLNSELLFVKHAVPFFKSGLKVLEIGPAGFPSSYQKQVNVDGITWHTIDFADTVYIEKANDYLTYKLDNPYVFPVPDAMYDVVLSGQVIEHVQKLWVWLKELKRVTKPGGLIIIINPVSWPYHEAPVDCWRIYPEGIKALAEDAGLDVSFCASESLETENLLKRDSKMKFIPGRSYNYTQKEKTLKKKIRWNKFIRKVPYFKTFLEIPTEVAYDTISVLKKV